jgi:FSR family fosmidomycin resistance protein-like MFS transporter
MMLAGLLSDMLLIPLLDKFDGLKVVRLSAMIVIPLYAAFLLAPWPLAKIALVVALRLATIGWWPVLEGQTFAVIPGKSGTVKAVGSLTGLLAGGLIAGIGLVAEQAGLETALWLLMAGPVALVLFTPRAGAPSVSSDVEV